MKDVEGNEVDLFRDTPLRYLGYANEVGEAFRSMVPRMWVHLSYLVASSYVLADTVSKSSSEWKTKKSGKLAALVGADVLVWQSLASVVVPGFVINRICAASRHLAERTPLASKSKLISLAVGLASIPLIIKPIDHGVDYALDRTLRPALGISSSK